MGLQRVLIHGKDQATNTPKPLAYNRGAMDVFVQDQNTRIVNWVLHQVLNNIVLAQHTTVNTNTMVLQAGHNLVNGNIVSLLQGIKFFQGLVTNVNVNTITLDRPFDAQFRADRVYIATRGNPNAAVDGSGTTVVFRSAPPQASQWDLTQLVVYFIDNAAMDDTTLGGIAAVTNGLVLRKKNDTYLNIGNIKKNGDFKAAGCEVVYAEKVGGGQFSAQAICKFRNDAGVTVRLDSAKNEEIELLVQDDIDAITSISATIIGHVVE